MEGGYSRTGSRSPMQWDKGLNAGFSSAPKEKLYIPLDESEDRPNAESQSQDICSLRSEVKRLIAFRQKHPALQSRGGITFLSDGYPLVYERTSDSQRIKVVINPSGEKAAVPNTGGSILYKVGSAAEIKDNTLYVAGGTAVFIEE